MEGRAMVRSAIIAMMLVTSAMSGALAQVDLSAHTDANGFINLQKLTCAQLAGTWQDDPDRLTAWYSGWYNGALWAKLGMK
jgi:hypothetical protein